MRISTARPFVIFCALALFFALPALAQESPDEREPGEEPKSEAAEKPDKSKKDKKGPKPFDEVITKEMVPDPGLFTVYREPSGDDVYFEIPVTELGQDMVWVTQVAETQAGYQWAGMPVGNRVVRWEQRGDRVLLRGVNYDIRADVDDPIRLAVDATSVSPVIHVFEIEAYGKDKAPVINASPLFTSDKREFSAQESLGVKGLDSKRTFVERVKSFPRNIETEVLATYKIEPERGGSAPSRERFPSAVRRDPSQSGVSVVLHHSMVKLPEVPMAPRVRDERVGFFSVGFTDFGDDSDHEAKQVRYITRWRLEKKKPQAKLSEPVQPIVWYVSREVPLKWQQACIDGINDWQPAFEAAGFKQAIIGKLAPSVQEDPDWDPEDARFTTIRWLPSAVPNAFGPHIHDPRTGEILEADVRMFHNVIKLARDWYFSQASPSDPRAQKLPLPDDLMAELVRFIVAHEVGHSLGFPHNMKASSSYTVAQLRDAEFTKRMGTAPSIMDYARFNYVAQPGDGAALRPAVGVYDRFAAEWGYREFPEGADEKAELEKIVARQITDPLLRFGNPNPLEDPTQQTEDLSGDAIGATTLGLANLERIADYLVSATSRPGRDYDLLANMHNAMLGQWRREMVHVANLVGGVEQVNLYYGDADRRFFPVDAGRQRQAMTFLAEHAFSTPEMFVRTDVTARLEASGVADRLLAAQGFVLRALLDEDRVKRMAQTAQGGAAGYLAADMLQDLSSAVWSELDGNQASIDLYRRNLQRAHVDLLADALESSETTSDLAGLARAELLRLHERCERAGQGGGDATTRAHLGDVAARIKRALEEIKVARAAPVGDGPDGGRGAPDPVVAGGPCWE